MGENIQALSHRVEWKKGSDEIGLILKFIIQVVNTRKFLPYFHDNFLQMGLTITKAPKQFENTVVEIFPH